MPRIFDNIDQKLLDALRNTLKTARRADFCVGYFNLRGWHAIDGLMENWRGDENGRCRLLIGMQEKPENELRALFSLTGEQGIDQGTAVRLRKQMAQEFRQQLLIGAPSNEDEEGLRRLSRELRSGKLAVRLFLRHKLHAKLYLLHQPDNYNVPIVGFLGSSNLTFAGLSGQGELNVDVVESDACQKLWRWFNDRWEDRWCLDISQELADIIDESWAREEMLLPYYIYLKMAYHLSEEARTGLLEFRIPRDFKDRLFEYQIAAVKIAAHHLNRRGGVLIGDVVGLGKTLMATTMARIMQDDYGTETLVLCPKNLVSMWRDYLHDYHLVGEVHSVSNVQNELPDLRRFRVVNIDESHNLRNREGKRYKVIKDYIEKNESKCILLTATPFNKTYLDLSAQLRLFLTDEQSRDLGIRPERLISKLGESTFTGLYQCPVRSLTAFEQSEYADDWRDLMRLYLVRRTRSFIQENYAQTDPETRRKYLLFSDGRYSYFPVRVPRTVKFSLTDQHANDPYALLYSDNVVEAINGLNLPRYGLGQYIATRLKERPTSNEANQLAGLSRARRRLMGFCRTNLFKRLESGGPAFLQSIERHVLRNYVFVHAIEHNLELPIGTQDAELLDPGVSDEDESALLPDVVDDGDGGEATTMAGMIATPLYSEDEYRRRAAQVYQQYAGQYRRRFKWLRPSLFNADLRKDLLSDAQALLSVLALCGTWNAEKDTKLAALVDLLTQQHPNEKVLVFTQFADTVHYLTKQLKARGITALEGVTGGSDDPTALAWRFSPVSSEKREQVKPSSELRVLIATDVLSEGQNLQDAAIVVNYDLPWAIIRLIQRAGRVDRIGQQSDTITCYSFLPAEGVERIIRLRERVRVRLRQMPRWLALTKPSLKTRPIRALWSISIMKRQVYWMVRPILR
jgi:Helicase conserved C-terminal domain/PLD-like domain/SNF2-related domain